MKVKGKFFSNKKKKLVSELMWGAHNQGPSKGQVSAPFS